jgi:RNA methyltransferase, TrmH family
MTSVPDVIRSRDNKLVKRLLRLVASARDRKLAGESVLDGAHLVEAYLQSGRVAREVIVSTTARTSDDWHRIEALLGDATNTAVHAFGEQLMHEASQLESPASVMAIIETPKGEAIPSSADAVLVLDSVQDPGNVGALLRSAAAFGIRHALLGGGTAFAWSPKVLRAGQGAHFSVNILEGADICAWLGGFEGQSLALVAAGADATPLAEANLTKPVALLVGNEGRGLSEEVISMATARVHIPMPGQMESLNAASCGAIAMYEFAQQRGKQANMTASRLASSAKASKQPKR